MADTIPKPFHAMSEDWKKGYVTGQQQGWNDAEAERRKILNDALTMIAQTQSKQLARITVTGSIAFVIGALVSYFML